MGEKEVCKHCKFYDRNVKGHCKAPKHIKDSCTYWDNEKQCIVPNEMAQNKEVSNG